MSDELKSARHEKMPDEVWIDRPVIRMPNGVLSGNWESRKREGFHRYIPDEELSTLTRCGIVELAARNPNVMEYMKHWEGRVEKAEAEVDRLQRQLDEERENERTRIIRLIDRRIEEYVRDEGSHDYSTNTTEFPEWVNTAFDELEFIKDAIRKGDWT